MLRWRRTSLKFTSKTSFCLTTTPIYTCNNMHSLEYCYGSIFGAGGQFVAGWVSAQRRDRGHWGVFVHQRRLVGQMSVAFEWPLELGAVPNLKKIKQFNITLPFSCCWESRWTFKTYPYGTVRWATGKQRFFGNPHQFGNGSLKRNTVEILPP